MYRVELTDRANEDLSRLDRAVAQRVTNRLLWLAENCETVSHYALTGRDAGKFRLRVGDYRALYWLDQERHRIVVEAIGHRSDVYR